MAYGPPPPGTPPWWDYETYGPYPGPGVLPAFPYGDNSTTGWVGAPSSDFVRGPEQGRPAHEGGMRGGPSQGRPAHGGGVFVAPGSYGTPTTGGPGEMPPSPSTPPAWIGGNPGLPPTIPSAAQPSYRQIGAGPWNNSVNFAAQNWTPDWFRTEHDNDKRAEASRRFRNDLSQGDEVAMQEWETYLANKMMSFLNPKDAAAVGMGLNVLGNDQGTYDTQAMGFNPATGMKAGADADVMYQQRGKWDAFDNMYGAAKTDLLGATTEQDFANDGTLDPFESMDRFVNEAKAMGQKFSLDPLARKNDTGEWATADQTRPGKSRLNRWEEQDLTEQWTNLASTSGIANNSPLFKAVQSMVMPTRYKPNPVRPAFRVGAPPRR